MLGVVQGYAVRGTRPAAKAQVTASVHDDASGWTVTQELDEQPKVSCG